MKKLDETIKREFEEEKIFRKTIDKIVSNNPILNRLGEERVFSFVTERKQLFIQENCDGYYCDKIDKEDCLALAKVFKELAEVM